MAKLGEDVTEVLDYVPGHFQVIRHVRPKYACTACDAITQAPAPAMPTPRGRATPATLAHLLVSKYCDHLPLYRQSEIYAREGLELDRSTLCDWVGQAAWLLDPIVAAIRAHVFAAEKIHGDDTTVPVLAPGLGRTKTGRLWVYVRDDRPFCGEAPPAAAYFYSPDRGGEHPAAHLANFTGLLQADGLCRVRGAVQSPPAPSPARSPKLRAGRIAAGRSSTFGRRRNRRSPRRRSIGSPRSMRSRTRPGLPLPPSGWNTAPRRRRCSRRSSTWAKATVTKLSAKSALAEAFRYTIKRREALTRFVTDGRLEADNNIAENACDARVIVHLLFKYLETLEADCRQPGDTGVLYARSPPSGPVRQGRRRGSGTARRERLARREGCQL
jgi:transposase